MRSRPRMGYSRGGGWKNGRETARFRGRRFRGRKPGHGGPASRLGGARRREGPVPRGPARRALAPAGCPGGGGGARLADRSRAAGRGGPGRRGGARPGREGAGGGPGGERGGGGRGRRRRGPRP